MQFQLSLRLSTKDVEIWYITLHNTNYLGGSMNSLYGSVFIRLRTDNHRKAPIFYYELTKTEVTYLDKERESCVDEGQESNQDQEIYLAKLMGPLMQV